MVHNLIDLFQPIMKVERERKWLMEEDAPPPDMPDFETMSEIRQAYLTIAEDTFEVRVREARRTREGSIGHTLTIKSAEPSDSRIEITRPIDAEDFRAIWDKSVRRIEKTRFEYPMGVLVGQPDVTLELDVFHDFDGLVIGEIEFESEKDLEAFDPPSWFGREVTEEEAYRNASIAMHTPKYPD